MSLRKMFRLNCLLSLAVLFSCVMPLAADHSASPSTPLGNPPPLRPVSALAASLQASAPTSGVYTETFASYANKDYAENTVWDPWAKEVRMGRLDAPPQGGPVIAVDQDQNTIVAWHSSYGDKSNIFVQKLDADGNRLWVSDVKANTTSGAVNPAIVVDAGGNAFVAWNNSANNNVYVQKLNSSGDIVWAVEKQVNANEIRGGNPEVAIDSSGDIILVWTTGQTNSNVYTQKLDADGDKLWAADKQANVDAGSITRLVSDVAADSNGNTVVVWVAQAWLETPGTLNVQAQRLDANGNALWASDIRVNAITGTASSPSVAMDGNGAAFVVWTDTRNTQQFIYAQYLDASGTMLWTTDKQVDPNSPGQFSPQVAMDTNQGIVVTWRVFSEGKSYAQKLDLAGNRLWATPVWIYAAGQPGAFDPPLPIAVSHTGKIVFAWRDYRNRDSNVVAQALDPNGEKQWRTGVQINSDGGAASQRNPVSSTDAAGNVYIAWDDTRLDAQDIYVRKLDAAGNRQWSQDVRANSKGIVHWDSIYPAIATNPSGLTTVVWADNLYEIYAQQLDSSGNKQWATEVHVGTGAGVAVASDEAGNAIIVWHFNNGNYAQKLAPDGRRLWAENTQIAQNLPGYSGIGAGDIALDLSGNAIIACVATSPNNNQDIYLQKLDGNGQARWLSTVQVNSATEQIYGAALAVAQAGNVLIAWSGGRNGNQDIFAQKLDASGNKLWGTDTKVNSDIGTAAQYRADIAVDQDGKAIILWGESKCDVSNCWNNLYAQKLDAAGNKVWPGDARIDQDTYGIVDMYWALAADKDGNATVVWQDERNANSDVFFQTIDANGVRGFATDRQLVDPDMFYFYSGTVQSRNINVTTDTVYSALLTAQDELNSGSIAYSLSNDGGLTWVPATPGVTTVFTTTGSDLRWQAALTSDPLWPRAPTITGLRIEYSLTPSVSDAYEPDDTCAAARPIAVNGAAQFHTFHQAGDEDWVRFDVISGTTYVIQTSHTQAKADTALALYSACSTQTGADDNNFGTDARITWQAPFSGAIYARVTNHDPATYGANTGYLIEVRTFRRPPVAVIVAGHDAAFSLQANIHSAADAAYRTFLNSGVPKANLRYFSPDPNRDVDGNGLNDDIYATATITKVRNTIQDWARDRGVGLGVPFYLYLVDHGAIDQFFADGPAGKITAGDLNLWLNNLEATSGADNINVILEACRSGSFINISADGPAKISGRNRVVIASTGSSLNAFSSQQGAYFSDAFWTALGQNKDLKTAFDTAQLAVQATGLNQTPWLDDNGDGVADSLDGAKARERGLGLEIETHPPVIDWVRASAISRNQATLQTQIRATVTVSRAWAVIYPPDFVEPPPTSNGSIPILNVPTITLTAAGANLYEGVYPDFSQTGPYRLVVYAQDAAGSHALPQTLTVIKAAATEQIAPMLKSRTEHGAACTSVYTLTNPTTATLSLHQRFYSDAGLQTYSFQDTLAAGQVKTYSLADMSAVPATFRGRLVVSASGAFTYQLNACPAAAGAPPAPPDAFEDDDVCSQAKSGTPDGASYAHTFHDLGDADWLKFDADAGTTYVLQTDHIGPDADTVLDLFATCASLPLASNDSPAFTDSRLVWTAPLSGTYYLRVSNHNPFVFGPNASYQVSVRAQPTASVVLIVAGAGQAGDPLQNNILYAANLAVRTFLAGGVPQANLKYLSAVLDARSDLNGDGVTDADGLATSASVQQAITGWAAGKTNAHTPFYLYLMDHGDVDLFQVNGLQHDAIRADQLNAWLTTLEAATQAPVVVIYEACHSGSFIDQDSRGPYSISRPGRVVIASTASGKLAFGPASGQGAFFSNAFWTALAQNHDVYNSFLAGLAAVRTTSLTQTPWLDDNGNALPNDSADGLLARRHGLAALNFAGERPPIIEGVSVPETISTAPVTLTAQVHADLPLARVWAVIYPPDFAEPDPNAATLTGLDLPEVTLTDPDGDALYTGSYAGFTQPGAYRIVVYAQDVQANQALPQAATVTNSSVGKLDIGNTGPANVVAGDPITYTLTVTNSGSVTTNHLVITDAIPSNASYISGGMRVGNIISWPITSLASGLSLSVQFAVTATQTLTNSDYGVKAEGGIITMGSEAVVTRISVLPSASTLVTPESGGILTMTFGNSTTTTVQIPPGSVLTNTWLVLAALTPVNGTPFSDFAFAGQAFALEAYQGEVKIALTFTSPITVILDYADTDVALLDETTLGLFYSSNSGWNSQGIAVVQRDTMHNRLLVTLTHLSDYALFGRILNDKQQVYLPLIAR